MWQCGGRATSCVGLWRDGRDGRADSKTSSGATGAAVARCRCKSRSVAGEASDGAMAWATPQQDKRRHARGPHHSRAQQGHSARKIRPDQAEAMSCLKFFFSHGRCIEKPGGGGVADDGTELCFPCFIGDSSGGIANDGTSGDTHSKIINYHSI